MNLHQKNLSPKLLDTLALADQGMDADEIAEHLGVSKSTVATRLSRARKILWDMGERGRTDPATMRRKKRMERAVEIREVETVPDGPVLGKPWKPKPPLAPFTRMPFDPQAAREAAAASAFAHSQMDAKAVAKVKY